MKTGNQRIGMRPMIILLGVALLAGCGGREKQTVEPPKDGWPAAVPETQGVDSALLLDMLRAIHEENIQIRSIIAVRHGRLVLEFYRYPYGRDVTFNTKSASKSIVSALVGVALREQWIESLDQALADLMPEYFQGDIDPLKKQITLRHILTMTSGLGIEEQSPEWGAIFTSEDPVRATLDFPMAAKPGETFNYLTPMPLLLAAVLERTGGMDLQTVCERHLFGPLDVRAAFWKPIEGRLIFSDTHMRPIDMAKFGMLYLRGGVWHQEQLLPRSWVEASTAPSVMDTGEPEGAYGLMWWIDREKHIFKALGWGGQGIYVLPDRDAVIVTTSSDYDASQRMVYDFLLPAMGSMDALPANPETVAGLTRMLDRFATADGDGMLPIKPHPKLAGTVDGVTYDLEPNAAGWRSMAFHFTEGGCRFTLGTDEGTHDLEVGLDNVYRLGDAGRYGERPDHNPVALRGKWSSEDTFFLDFLQLGRPEHAWIDVRFKEDEIDLRVELAGTGGFSMPMSGKRRAT